jgi:DNA-binding response OmpR family regulator
VKVDRMADDIAFSEWDCLLIRRHRSRVAMPGVVVPETLVLIVDDDAEAREDMAVALVAEGYVVQSVANADAALAQLAGGVRPALVIVNPGIGSGDFIRDLRATANAKVPVLLISGARLEHIELDANACLRKPTTLTALVRGVEQLTCNVDL